MPNWSYRVVRSSEDDELGDTYGIYYVVTDDLGNIQSWDEQPVIEGDSVETLMDTIQGMLDALIEPATDMHELEESLLDGSYDDVESVE